MENFETPSANFPGYKQAHLFLRTDSPEMQGKFSGVAYMAEYGKVDTAQCNVARNLEKATSRVTLKTQWHRAALKFSKKTSRRDIASTVLVAREQKLLDLQRHAADVAGTIPTESCRCGFYAVAEKDRALSSKFPGATGGTYPWVGLLKVQGYGTVLVGKYGWRAEKQLVEEIFLQSTCILCGTAIDTTDTTKYNIILIERDLLQEASFSALRISNPDAEGMIYLPLAFLDIAYTLSQLPAKTLLPIPVCAAHDTNVKLNTASLSELSNAFQVKTNFGEPLLIEPGERVSAMRTVIATALLA